MKEQREDSVAPRVGGREQAHLGRNQVCRRGEVRTPDLELEKCDVFPMERNV